MRRFKGLTIPKAITGEHFLPGVFEYNCRSVDLKLCETLNCDRCIFSYNGRNRLALLELKSKTPFHYKRMFLPSDIADCVKGGEAMMYEATKRIVIKGK